MTSTSSDASTACGDDDLLPLSALQHLVFCERQCVLIHAEGAWSENRWTAQGRAMHERVHAQTSGLEEGRVVARGLRLVSRRLGLAGVADVVEFHPADPGGTWGSEGCGTGGCGTGVPPVAPSPPSPGLPGIRIPGRPGRWQPFPVEYKRGRPKAHDADAVQICAQAMCLEEMLAVAVPRGALFYGQTRRRQEVCFDGPLRRRVEQLAGHLHDLIQAGVTPPPEPGPKCKNCSLKPLCLPDVAARRRVSTYVDRTLKELLAES